MQCKCWISVFQCRERRCAAHDSNENKRWATFQHVLVYTLDVVWPNFGGGLRRLTIATPSATPTAKAPPTNVVCSPATLVALVGCRCGGGGQGVSGHGAVAGRRVSSCLRNRSPTSQPCRKFSTTPTTLGLSALMVTLGSFQQETLINLSSQLCGIHRWNVNS